MAAPRTSAGSRMAGPTMTQAAREAASCCWYRGLLRKLSWLGVATSSGAMPSRTSPRSPWSSPPSASTRSPRRSRTAASLDGVERLDHLVGDVVLRVDVDRFLQHEVVLLLLGDLLDDAVGAFEDLLQLLVLAGGEVFLEFAALALELAVLVDQLLLALGALAFRQGGRLALELVGGGLDRVAQVVEILLALGELLLQLGLRRLGAVGLAEHAVGVHETDAEVLRERGHGHRERSQQGPEGTTAQRLH